MLSTLRRQPWFLKFMMNAYAPYVGAGVRVRLLDLEAGMAQVDMPLTRLNRNYVGTQFGGSLYSMVDPFLMLLLMHQLGEDYIVWDKAAAIDFQRAGRGRVSSSIQLDRAEVELIRQLAASGAPVLRQYVLNILADDGSVVAVVDKTLYIRKKKAKI